MRDCCVSWDEGWDVAKTGEDSGDGETDVDPEVKFVFLVHDRTLYFRGT